MSKLCLLALDRRYWRHIPGNTSIRIKSTRHDKLGLDQSDLSLQEVLTAIKDFIRWLRVSWTSIAFRSIRDIDLVPRDSCIREKSIQVLARWTDKRPSYRIFSKAWISPDNQERRILRSFRRNCPRLSIFPGTIRTALLDFIS
jgi:hypothetical protein